MSYVAYADQVAHMCSATVIRKQINSAYFTQFHDYKRFSTHAQM